MASAFQESKKDFINRLMDALDAAETVGGDARGMQSAAIMVVKTSADPKVRLEKVIDLRVEDSPQPHAELHRLVEMNEAYTHAARGDDLMMVDEKIEEAIEEYKRAIELAPEIEELKFWAAVAMLDRGKTQEATALLKEVFAKNGDWKPILLSLTRVKFLTLDEKIVSSLLQ
jgi:uncharacterized Ntn-hydrolase superfamily protein